MIDGEIFFDQPIKNNKTTYDNIKKIATGQEDDYTTVVYQTMITLEIVKK